MTAAASGKPPDHNIVNLSTMDARDYKMYLPLASLTAETIGKSFFAGTVDVLFL